MSSTPSFCRTCHNYCPIVVDVEGGKVVRVSGDRQNEVYEGYTCVKGRALPELTNHRSRLLHSMKRTSSGFEQIDVRQAMDEIAAKLIRIIDDHGAPAVATYLGTHAYVASPLILPVANAFSDAIGSPARLTPLTIDQPGKILAPMIHGIWMTPMAPFQKADVALMIGINPMVSHYLTPNPNPGKWMDDVKARRVKLITIDPRRTEVARRSWLHIQPRPGQDVAIVAAMLRVILDEGLGDDDFLRDNVDGLSALRAAIAPFTPAEAAHRADVSADDIVLAARTFANASRGWGLAGTGPSMAQSSTVLEYLLLCLKTVCGYWPRAGELVGNPGTLRPAIDARAQAVSPMGWRSGSPVHVRDLEESDCGIPIGAAAERMLMSGEGKIRALISCSGNPVAAWPDQARTIEGLRALDLLVQIDPWMSETSKVADYVIAPTMCLESPATTLFTDMIDATSGPGLDVAHAQYTAAIVEPPEGSDVLEEWEFFYGIAQRMGLSLELQPLLPGPGAANTLLDMSQPPTTDELLKLTTQGSRISLDEVKRHPHGATFGDPAIYVQPKDDGWEGRLDVGNDELMEDLDRLATMPPAEDDPDRPFRLINRRLMNSFNSSCHDESINRGRSYNPAFMNPADLEHLGLAPRDMVEIRSRRATIRGVLEADAAVRPGCISMSHGFGGVPGDDDQVLAIGSSTARLLDRDDVLERYSAQPRMSGIPVAVVRTSSS